MKTLQTIYTASYGFQDNDAIAKVWGRTPAYCAKILRSAIAETGRMYATEEFSSWAIKAQIWYVGPFAEDVAIIELEDSSRANEWADDMAYCASGYVH